LFQTSAKPMDARNLTAVVGDALTHPWKSVDPIRT
jgi:hypothetical protein